MLLEKNGARLESASKN